MPERKKLKEHIVFYKCPYCNLKVSGKIKDGSRLVKCDNSNCGKFSDISLVEGFDDHIEKIQTKIKKAKKMDMALISILVTFAVICLVVLIGFFIL